VAAGLGLLGGGTSGVVSLAINMTVVQSRVVGSCPPGNSISAINLNGTVVCELDDIGLGDISSVTAGAGLTGGGTIGDVTLAIATSGVTSSHLAPDSVGASEIATGAVGTSEIATDAVGSSEIATDAVGALEVLDGSLQDIDLATSTTGSGTATVETTIRRFFIDKTNDVNRARIQVACNGEFQGDEATIRVYRGAVLFDTYVCPANGGRPWTYFSPRFSIAYNDTVDVTYQLTSPGLFYWREVTLEGDDRPEPITVSAQNSATDYLASTCTSVTGTISVVAPGPGTVIVNANAWLRMHHTAGLRDQTVIVLSETSGGDCNSWQHTRVVTIPSGYPTTIGEI